MVYCLCEHEPLYDPQHPLLQLPNVLCSPHLGYVERASYRQYLQVAFAQLLRYRDGERSHVLNPESLSHRRQQESQT